MQFINKIRTWLQSKREPQALPTTAKPLNKSVVDRLARLEHNYLVLLKRLLEMDGIQLLHTKSNNFNNKILQTPNDIKGLNEPKPTIH